MNGPEGLQGIEGDDPRRHRGGKVLAVEGAERLRLPLLDVPGAPVVHDDHPEDVVLCLLNRDAVAHGVAGADKACLVGCHRT